MAKDLVNIVLVLCAVNFVNGLALPFEGLYKLDIIHYNDFHARFEETSVATPTCRTNDSRCLGGLPRLFYQIRALLKEKPDALLLDAGDSFQGTYWFTLLKWNITQEFKNMLPHDAHAIGNHEFDDGPAGLAPYLSHLRAPVLAANMDAAREPVLQGLFRPHVIVQRCGRSIGIIGLITQDTKTLSTPGNVVFTEPGEALRREARRLAARGADIIVLLSHCGLQLDKQLAREHGEYVDIIIGGHSHSLLWDGPTPSNETAEGPYPVFVENTSTQKQVLIVQASAFTKYMGNLSVYFDYKGDLVDWEGGPIFLNRSIPEDEEIKAKLAPYAKLVHEAENADPYGESLAPLNADDCVFGECALGDLLVDAFLELGKSKVQTDLPHMSFLQRGNIKSSLTKGNITKGMIFELLPYDDRVESFELQGKYILEALERSVSDAWGYRPFKGPWVLQVAGLQVTYDVSLPQGRRLTSALAGGRGATDPQPIAADRMYQLTLPAFLANGGDGFTMFKEGRRNVQMIGRDQASVGDYIKRHSPINIQTDGRIVILE